MTTDARAFHIPRVPPRCCRWCAAPITRGRKDRTWHDGREDEPDCFGEYALHTRREVQYAHVLDRDGPWCWDCKGQPLKVVAQAFVQNRAERIYLWRDWHTTGAPVIGECVGAYCEVEIKFDVELEHTTPLWRTTHLTWEDRRPYFGPKNLRLRCPACHAPKTSQEATLRAKEKRQAKLRVGAERKEPRRKIQGRGFQGGHRPMQSRPFEKMKP